MANILIVDDEKEICTFLYHLFGDLNHDITICTSGEEFDQIASKKEYDLAFLDVKLPDRNGLMILQDLKTLQPLCKVVVMTGYGTVKTAVEAIKQGANDFIEKPFDDITDIENLAEQLLNNGLMTAQCEIHELASRLDCFIGNNEEMKQLFKLAYKFAQKNITILIEGETGTGKEVLAHYIHHASLRDGQPFVGVNCGAISENLLESELFGHVKGAFTGAAKDRKGFFELAGKGTLFLDEIGEASLPTQVKLLRVLETGEFMKLGGERIEWSKARVIAATNVDLYQAVREGSFREDLLYRLDVIKLTIPPLRNRLDDIPLFIEDYLRRQHSPLTFSQETIDCLCAYSWPGNVRELVNVIKRAIALAEEETTFITPSYLPKKFILQRKVNNSSEATRTEASNSSVPFEQFLGSWTQEMLDMLNAKENHNLNKVLDMHKSLESELTQAFIKKALQKTIGNRTEAAEELGISLRKLRYYLNEKR